MNKEIVLVHGAWMDARAWQNLTPLLEAQGYTVTVVNLPGHGEDNTPAATLQLANYSAAVLQAIGDRKVILAGHSMAGMVITDVAQQIPDQIERLIYIAAYLPANGESLYQLAQRDTSSHINKYWRQDDAANYSPAYIAAEGIKECFAADCTDEVVAGLIANHKPEPLAPMGAPVVVGEHFAGMPKTYIHTTADNAVSYMLQQQMVAVAGVQKIHTMHTSHCPFLSQPEELAKLMTL